jgi:hypothetical protein
MKVPYDPEHVTYFAEANFRNQQTRFGIKSRDRTRHMYVVGKSGVGKSTLLENMAIQDIQNGQGVAVLDPHGSFAEKMLDYIPEHRIKDVVYFAPFDLDHPVSFNMLEDVGADKRHFVASGLMSTFKKIWVDAWSARMEYILNNILLALLEYPDATLLGVNRMLSDKDFRKKVVANISDPSVKSFWTDEFEKYGERYMQEAGAAIQNKIGQFTANPLVRNIVGQPKSSFDVRDIMDNQKILIVNLSKGRIGEQNTSLLGSMIITKIYIAAMSRADVSYARMADLPSFYFYVDEFQSFANESFANILSEARKYKLALIIAHQYIAQMEESVRDAVFGNVGTSLSFRVGPLDAEVLEKVYAPQFTANDLINLGMAQVYLSLMINDIGSQPFSAKTIAPIPRPDISYRNDVIEWTRAHFAKPKETVENNIREWFGKDTLPGSSHSIEGDKNFKPRDDKKPYTPYVPKQNTTTVSTPTAAPIIKPKEEVKYHTPFKKALETAVKEDPVSTQEVPKPSNTFVKKEFITPKVYPKPTPKIETTDPVIREENNPSPKLIELIDAIDSSPKKVQEVVAPFSGEKTLRETIAPVKHAERGPTEANRNLLKEALLKATMPEKSVSVEDAPKEKVLAKTSEPNKILNSQRQNNGEVSHEELQKILE